MEDIHQDKPSLSFLQRSYAKSCDILNDSAEYFASFSIGQSVLRQTDRLLWTVEKCAEWSVPTAPVPKQNHSNGAFGKAGPLVRPLPWLIFLPMLLFLRVVRFSLNIGAMLVGIETIKPIQMVRFVQVRRRRIRALKFMGLRRIRQKRMDKETQLTWKESFYNVMSRAMCFRVTNSDLYEQITVKKETADEVPGMSSKRLVLNANIAGQSLISCQGHKTNLEFRFAMQLIMHPRSEQQCNCLAITSGEKQSTSKPKPKPSGKDLKRKYIEILKNNYLDWEDVEDDEELIDRITQLAEDDDNDSDYVPAEDSATEDDSMSDAEEDAVIPSHPQQNVLHRLTSQSSLSNVTIAEENEEEHVDSDSNSATVSANSEDESSQHMSAGETPKKIEPPKDKSLLLQPTHSEMTSDEYYSPVNSISTSPEPKQDDEINKFNKQNNTQLQEEAPAKLDDKTETENFINSESKQVANALNNNNSNSSTLPANNKPITAHETGNVKPHSNSHTSFSPRGHGKKHKHKRRLSNLLRRKNK